MHRKDVRLSETVLLLKPSSTCKKTPSEISPTKSRITQTYNYINPEFPNNPYNFRKKILRNSKKVEKSNIGFFVEFPNNPEKSRIKI